LESTLGQVFLALLIFAFSFLSHSTSHLFDDGVGEQRTQELKFIYYLMTSSLIFVRGFIIELSFCGNSSL
jgi:hypothetical protein